MRTRAGGMVMNPLGPSGTIPEDYTATGNMVCRDSRAIARMDGGGRNMTLLYSDPLFLKHDTGRHVETADRLRAILARIEKAGLVKKCTAGVYKPLTEEAVAGLHDPKLVQSVKQLAAHGGGRIDADTVVSPDSYQVALAAAGAGAAAVDAVLKGDDRTALCLVRPPGHHATPKRSMGFCLFNN